MNLLVYVFVILGQLADLGSSLLGFRHGAIELNVLGQTPFRLIALKVLAIAVIVAVLYLSGRLRNGWVVAAGAVAVSLFTYAAAWHNLA